MQFQHSALQSKCASSPIERSISFHLRSKPSATIVRSRQATISTNYGPFPLPSPNDPKKCLSYNNHLTSLSPNFVGIRRISYHAPAKRGRGDAVAQNTHPTSLFFSLPRRSKEEEVGTLEFREGEGEGGIELVLPTGHF